MRYILTTCDFLYLTTTLPRLNLEEFGAWSIILPLLPLKKGGQANGLISIGRLNILLCVHFQPINHVVYMVSHWDTLS